jgi:hypothetical protein
MSQGPTWRKSGRCANNGCIEAAWGEGTVKIRNSTVPDRIIEIDVGAWIAFIHAVKSDVFQHPRPGT